MRTLPKLTKLTLFTVLAQARLYIYFIFILMLFSEGNNPNADGEIEKLEVECLEDRYELLGEIGSGSFAQVLKGREKFGSGEVRAIKRIQINPLADELSEISHLKTLKCDHIIEFYGYMIVEQSNELNIIMQLCKGSLRDQIEGKRYFSPGRIFDLVTQVTNAMLHLNDKFIMHLDLKPENILFEEDSFYKLCDFGCAQLFQNISKMASNQKADRNRMLSSVGLEFTENTFGTPRYIAPEIQLNLHKIGKNSCDMWSLGIILYELIYKNHPFELDQRGRVKDKIITKYYAGSLSINYPETKEKYPVQLMKLMLEPHPTKRITWRKLKQILLRDYGRHEAEFLNIEVIANRQFKISLILTELTMLIEHNIEQSYELFWKQNLQLMLDFKRIITLLGYSHLIKFYALFGYKMKNKLPATAIASFDFMLENLEDEVFAEENPEQNHDLRDYRSLEKTMIKLVDKIEQKLESVPSSQQYEKLKVFIKQVHQLEGANLFCNGHRFPKSCINLQIREQL